LQDIQIRWFKTIKLCQVVVQIKIKMATKNDSLTGLMAEDALQREEFADFTLVLKDGQELKCHKFKLAEVSLVFRAMLRKDCVETQTSRMKVTEFDRDTVESFLDHIYADLEMVSGQDVSIEKRNFDMKRLTPALLRMCHMYEVKDLQERCVQYLTENIEDINAVDIWSAAEMISNEDLKNVALMYLWSVGPKLPDVPGLKDTFQSPILMESFVNYICRQREEHEVITVTVRCLRLQDLALVEIKLQVKWFATVKDMRFEIDNYLKNYRDCPSLEVHRYRCKAGSLKIASTSTILEEHKKVNSYKLKYGSKILCDVFYE